METNCNICAAVLELDKIVQLFKKPPEDMEVVDPDIGIKPSIMSRYLKKYYCLSRCDYCEDKMKAEIDLFMEKIRASQERMKQRFFPTTNKPLTHSIFSLQKESMNLTEDYWGQKGYSRGEKDAHAYFDQKEGYISLKTREQTYNLLTSDKELSELDSGYISGWEDVMNLHGKNSYELGTEWGFNDGTEKLEILTD